MKSKKTNHLRISPDRFFNGNVLVSLQKKIKTLGARMYIFLLAAVWLSKRERNKPNSPFNLLFLCTQVDTWNTDQQLPGNHTVAQRNKWVEFIRNYQKKTVCDLNAKDIFGRPGNTLKLKSELSHTQGKHFIPVH